ncbi:WYL domain-containing protein [Ochrobactrum sp. BTU1]|uniref:WYL domain-containing protein n=1 Tax=Ochrobactrum sp. BTU1 TaxID=2840456 RepID=UPI001C045F50|nr:WYL domain-containing protein [Ochrobactrum sp. BTU1]
MTAILPADPDARNCPSNLFLLNLIGTPTTPDFMIWSDSKSYIKSFFEAIAIIILRITGQATLISVYQLVTKLWQNFIKAQRNREANCHINLAELRGHMLKFIGTKTVDTPVKEIRFRYMNWRGESSIRAVIPIQIWFGSTEWHPEDQWFLKATDLEKGAERDFALLDINFHDVDG